MNKLLIGLSLVVSFFFAVLIYFLLPPTIIVPPEKVAVVLQPEKVVVTVVPEKVAIIVPPVAIVVPKKVIKPTIPQVIFIGVTTVNPVDFSESDDLNNNIIVTFTEAMDSESVNENTFQVKKTDGGDIKGVISPDESKKVWTFNPKDKLDIKSEYTVTITKGAKGVSGNSFVENFVWSFTTRSGGGSSSSNFISNPTSSPTSILTTLTLSPIIANLTINSTLQLTATSLDQYGDSITVIINYTSSNSSIATVNGSGFVVAISSGNATITGLNGIIGGASVISVEQASLPEPILTSLILSPTLVNLTVGSSQQLNATTLDQYGSYFNTSINYTSSNLSIATVSATGLVTAVAVGNTTISGTSGVIGGLSIITVTEIGSPGPATVNLGVSSNFSVIAQTLISDATPAASTIIGNIGIYPAAGSLISGISCTKVVGNIYDNNAGYSGGYDSNVSCLITDAVATLAVQSAMVTAYGDARGRTFPNATELGTLGDISGLTFTPGLYKWSTGVNIGLGGVTLNCQGNTNSVFIFQISQDLTVANGATVNLIDCQAKNIFWQTDTQAVLGTTSVFNGNILAGTAIVINSGATLNGRAFAQSAVTLDDNTILIQN